MPDAKVVFNEIITSALGTPMAVFDLDSTLYNVSLRTQKIIVDFTADPEHQKLFPSEVLFLKKAKIESRDWGLKEALLRGGLSSTPLFYNTIRDYWKKHFFSSPYLKFDVPYEGAVEYVQDLQRNGVIIKYLTGRDSQNMLAGTIESLKKFNFPITDIANQLIMKPIKGLIEDQDFKTQKFIDLKTLSKNIWFFENEPVIIHKVIESFPEIKIVWVDTTHSRRAEPPSGIYTIQDKWRRS